MAKLLSAGPPPPGSACFRCRASSSAALCCVVGVVELGLGSARVEDFLSKEKVNGEVVECGPATTRKYMLLCRASSSAALLGPGCSPSWTQVQQLLGAGTQPRKALDVTAAAVLDCREQSLSPPIPIKDPLLLFLRPPYMSCVAMCRLVSLGLGFGFGGGGGEGVSSTQEVVKKE